MIFKLPTHLTTSTILFRCASDAILNRCTGDQWRAVGTLSLKPDKLLVSRYLHQFAIYNERNVGPGLKERNLI